MSRIPYTAPDVNEPKDLVDSIRTRRGGRLLNLDRMLLQSPPFARGWNTFLGQVRNGLDLSPKLRELAICVVAVLNNADYEFYHHAPEFIKAGGNEHQLAALQWPEDCIVDHGLFDPSERAVINLALEMTRNVDTADTTFADAVEALGNHQHVVDLVGVIAAYNMVSRFLVALHIEPEAVEPEELHYAIFKPERTDTQTDKGMNNGVRRH